MEFEVYVNVLHADNTMTNDFRWDTKIAQNELGDFIARSFEEAKEKFGHGVDEDGVPHVTLDLTVSEVT